MKQDLQYYMIDFNEPARTPELFRCTAFGEVYSTMKAMASQWNWRIIHLGASRPSMKQMNELLTYPMRHLDGE
tara:strand:- start:374 stop:592 length:219 start_codon:yes stop_codon:yes gene_type:complete